MKVLFVNLYDFTSSRASLPLGIQSLYLLLENKSDFDAEICDFNKLYDNNLLTDNNFQENINDMANYIISREAKIVSIYTMCNNYHIALLLCRELNKLKSDIFVILAGPQATMVARETLMKYEYVNYIALGEGEDTILPILQGIVNNNLDNVNGVAYRKHNGVIDINWDKTKFVDINKLEIFDIEEFYRDEEIINIEVGRGCPFHCSFCSTKNFWCNNYRLKSVERIIQELEFYIDKYQMKSFVFQHDLFTYNRKYIIKFCDEILERGIDIKWACSSRIDVINEEMISKMSLSGCNCIYFGIETGSQDIQDIINKNIKIEKVEETARLVKKYNIDSIFSFIYGFPSESEHDLNQTLQLIYKLKKIEAENKKVKNTIQLWPLNFLPGTEMGEEYKDKLIFQKTSRTDFSYNKYIDNEEVSRIISNDKDVFINYYNLPKNYSERYMYLSPFIMGLFNNFYKYSTSSIDMIIEYYNGNILKMYDDILGCCLEQITKFFNVKANKYKMKEEISILFTIFETFLKKKDINILRPDVYEIFIFERDIFDFIHFEFENKKIKNYHYNVYDFLSNQNISLQKQNNCLKFIKDEYGARIQKV